MQRTIRTAAVIAAVLMAGVSSALGLTACGAPTQNADFTGDAVNSEPTATEAGSVAVVVDDFALGHFPAVPTGDFEDSDTRAFQAVLDTAVDHGLPGVTATVMAADGGVWTGAAGTADGHQPMHVDSQFGIASTTKTFVAAELMRLSEAGQLNLDDPVSAHLPASLEFDSNGATVRDLLAMRSGIPEPTLLDGPGMETDPQRAWTASEILASVPAVRAEPGRRFVYENTNYILLGLVVEEVTGVSVAEALRAHMTADPALSSIVYQPEERPLGPLALPFLRGQVRPDIVDVGGGYLPTKASASAGGGAGCMAADSAALARWGYLLFGGHLISEQSILAMTDFDDDGYGLGVFDQSKFFPELAVDAVGNGGWDIGGYSASLSVLPAQGLVISVLSNMEGHPATHVFPVAQELASVLEP